MARIIVGIRQPRLARTLAPAEPGNASVPSENTSPSLPSDRGARVEAHADVGLLDGGGSPRILDFIAHGPAAHVPASRSRSINSEAASGAVLSWSASSPSASSRLSWCSATMRSSTEPAVTSR